MARREARDDARIRVVQVAAGEAHTLALTAAGGVFTWGRGLFGRLGVGALQDELVPTQVAVGTNDDDDGAWSCHSGSSHSSGGRDDSSRGHYAREKDGGSSIRCKVTQVAAGAYHNLALTADGTVYSWGYNAYGQLGREKTASQPSHVTFSSRSPAEDFRRGGAMWLKGGAKTTDLERAQPKMILVDAGGMISCAVDVDGALWLWGAVPNPSEYPDSYSRNSFSVVNIERPERVRGLLGLRVYRIACGNEHILALVEGRDDTDLDCYAWGNNQFGQLGLGDFRDRPCPQVVKALAASAVGLIVDLACGAFHTAILAVKDYHPTDLVLEPSSSPKGRRHKGWDVIQDSPTPTPKHSFFRTHQPIVDQLDSLRNNNSPKPRMRQDSETSSSLKSTALGSSRMSSSRSLGQPSRSDGRFSLEGRLSVCWTFGQGENGQLGHGTNANQAHPGPVEGLPNERLRTVACGLFHTAVVTETGDVWVWGMEGGLGLCPGIGPPGARSGDALAPVRVFGESSGNCHPVTGSKGITCGAAHTVTMSNVGKDLWAWGRGQSGVLGLGHISDSWFPCPVVWPPVSLGPWSGGTKGNGPQPDPLYPMGFDCRRSTRSLSGTNSRDRADSVKSSSKDSVMMDNRRFEQFEQSAEHPLVSEEAEMIKKEIAGVRRYGASLHAAVYGEVEVFSQQLPEESLYSDRNSDDGISTHQKHDSNGGVIQKKKPLQEWERRMETASDADLASLDHYYRSMRVRLKEVLFQRKMDEWCRRCMSAINSSGVALEPPPRREMYSTASSQSMDGSGDWASVSKSGLFGDKGEMLPPPAAEFRMLAGRQR